MLNICIKLFIFYNKISKNKLFFKSYNNKYLLKIKINILLVIKKYNV